MSSLRIAARSGHFIQFSMHLFQYQYFIFLTFSLLAGLGISELGAATQYGQGDRHWGM